MIVDSIKVFFKEDFFFIYVNLIMYWFVFWMVVVLFMCFFVVIFFGFGDIFVIFNVGIGVFFLFVMGSFGVYGSVFGGWVSNFKYSLLGGFRIFV